MQILDQLWYGNIRPAEKTIKHSSEYTRLFDKISKRETELTDKLSSEQFEMFDKYMSDYNCLRAIVEGERFIFGFRTGAKIMLDIFVDGEVNET